MPDFKFQHVRYSTMQGKQDGGPHLLILAGVHGDEYEPIATAIKLIPMVADVLTSGRVSIVPIVNEPAFKGASRYGADGLNLARICPGNQKGTVTEVIAAEVSELIAQSDYLIDLHTGGNGYEIAPLCGYMLHASEEIKDKQHHMAQAFNLQTIWATSNELDGRTLSVARDYNIPAIYAEFGGGGGCKEKIVTEYIQGCLNVVNGLGMAAGEPAPSRVDYIVKDARKASGYLQVKLPAPCGGFYQTEVDLGSVVEEGQQIGAITNPLNQSVCPVHADQNGMLFLTRAIPSVQKGDSLGGILPITQSGEVTIS